MGIVKKLSLFNNSNHQLSSSPSSSGSKKESKSSNSKSCNSSGTASTLTSSSNNFLDDDEKSVHKDNEAVVKQPHTSTTHSPFDSNCDTPEDSKSVISLSDLNSIGSDFKKPEEHHGHTLSNIFHKFSPHSMSPHLQQSNENHHEKHHNLHISLQQQKHELNLLKEHNERLHQMLLSNVKVFGLENFGNTCYMNSIIQCLFVLDGFKNRLMEAHLVKEIHLQRKNYLPMRNRQFTHNSLTNNGQKSKNKMNCVKVVNIDSVLHNLGIKIPSDKIIVGRSSDSKTHSNDTRKKNALLKGPVINVDHLSLNYQGIEKSLDKDDSKRLYYALKDLFEIIVENEYSTGVVSPSDFLATLRTTNLLFQGGMHQDSQEFLNFLLNSMNEHLEHLQKQEDIITTENNFIKDYFQGSLVNNIKCLNCSKVSQTFEPFFDIQIPVSKKFKNLSYAFNNLIESPSKEVLKGSNKFYCDHCCELQKAERVVEISKLPKFLILNLKRYEYSEKENKMVKLFNKMEYPLLLKIDSLKRKYELSGIVVHLGLDSSHGHYVSIVKNEKLGWLIYDDETVMGIQEQDVLKFYGNVENMSCAYLLFYKEIDSPASGERSNGTSSPTLPALAPQISSSRKSNILSLKKDTTSLKQKDYDTELRNFIERDELFRLKHKSLAKLGLEEAEPEINTPPVTPNASETKLNFLLSSNSMAKKSSSTLDDTSKALSRTQLSSAGSESGNSGIKRSRSRFWKKIIE